MLTFRDYIILNEQTPPSMPQAGGLGIGNSQPSMQGLGGLPGGGPSGMPPSMGGPPGGGIGLGGPPMGGLGGGMGGLGGPDPMMGMGGGMGGQPQAGQNQFTQLKPLDIWSVMEKILAGKKVDTEKDTGHDNKNMLNSPQPQQPPQNPQMQPQMQQMPQQSPFPTNM